MNALVEDYISTDIQTSIHDTQIDPIKVLRNKIRPKKRTNIQIDYR